MSNKPSLGVADAIVVVIDDAALLEEVEVVGDTWISGTSMSTSLSVSSGKVGTLTVVIFIVLDLGSLTLSLITFSLES